MSEPEDVRERLLEVAARVLGEEGPAALSTRRLASEAGTSTMAVYTHFGGMPALVRAVVAEGFRRLHDRVGAVPRTDDPVADLEGAWHAYHDHARANPHLYAVMFGSASLGTFRLHDEELGVGLAAFRQIVEATRRVVESVPLEVDATALAAQLWLALHGFVMAELAGLVSVVADPEEQVLRPMLTSIVTAHLPTT